MNLEVFSILLFFFGISQVDGQNLGFPDYDSGWLLMKSQDNELSTLDVHHGLGQLPALVDVRVKSVSEPNKDFIFKGVGNAARDDDFSEDYASVVYIYNESTVRLFVPKQRNGFPNGHVIYTGYSPHWKGVNNQTSSEALVKVLCWSPQRLPDACYDVSNLTVNAGSSIREETYLELEHELDQLPDFVNVRAKLLDGNDVGWYIDGVGSNFFWMKSMTSKKKTGGLIYGYSNKTVRIWISSVISPGNVLFSRNDGWGNLGISDLEERFFKGSQIGTVEVRVWCYFGHVMDRTTVPIGADVANESLELQLLGLNGVDFVSLSVKLAPRNGANEGYLFDGAGAAFVLNDITRKGAPCSYGGVVYAYNDTTLRIWRPDHSDGAAVCIGDEMGQGINSQASNSVNLVVTVWGLPYEPEQVFEEPVDSCNHFQLIAENSQPLSSSSYITTITETVPSTAVSCARSCIRYVQCQAFAPRENGCDLYSSTEFESLVPMIGSQVWGLMHTFNNTNTN